MIPDNGQCCFCGYCCRQGVCPFGNWDEEKKQCAHLTEDNKCAIYDEIKNKPGAEFAPAFGAGCCCSLNSERLAIIKGRQLTDMEWLEELNKKMIRYAQT